MARPAPYSYSDAGYNGFFRRTLVSNANADTLRVVRGSSQQMNFDDLQTSGALGDRFKVGRIVINGKEGRVEIQDEQGNEVVRLGQLDG